MTEKTEKKVAEKKPAEAKAKPAAAKKEPAPRTSKKESNGSSNGTNSSEEEKGDRPQAEKKAPPTAEDLERYKQYVGQQWRGRCRWFNVTKGFGFIDPHNEEATKHDDDVFVHQVA